LPYMSPAARERANWRTLPEAVAHIVRVDRCQPDGAQRQIGEALGSGDLSPLRWEDEQPTPRVGGAMMPDDAPPRKWSAADIAEIDWEHGTAIDRSEYGFLKKQRRRLMFRRRRLLIHRLAIAQWWPESAAPPSRPKPTAAELDAWMQHRVTRGTKRDDAIQACHDETGATFRDAGAAYTRLPDDVKLKRGQRAGLRKIEQ
jgi:hypothetical protein